MGISPSFSDLLGNIKCCNPFLGRWSLLQFDRSPEFEYVRGFYRQHGYEEEARIRDFYAEGADKIIFRKALSSQEQ